MTEHEGDFAGIINDQARRLFERCASPEALAAADGGAFASGIWTDVEAAGLPLALLAEEAGGIGLSPEAAFGIVRLAAYFGLPVPLGETMVVAALTGEAPVGPASFALADGAGIAARVAYGQVSSAILVEAPTGWVLCSPCGDAVAVERNLAGEPRDTFALALAAGKSVQRPVWLAGAGLLQIGAALRALQMSGAMRRVLDLAIEHVTMRQQFGRPLGEFQAIQHLLADAAAQVAAATAIADSAVEAWGRPDFALRATLAKARVGEAATLVAAIGHQVHGAMGFTQEHVLHVFTRRLWAWRDEFGGEATWNEQIGRAICAGGGAVLWQNLVAMTSETAS